METIFTLLGFNLMKSNLAKSDMIKNFIHERKRKSSGKHLKIVRFLTMLLIYLGFTGV